MLQSVTSRRVQSLPSLCGEFGFEGTGYSNLYGAKAGQVPLDRAPGRIGFMSTQRRASRTQRVHRTNREAMKGLTSSDFGTRFGLAIANGATAPLMSIMWIAWAWLLQGGAKASRGAQAGMATGSLLSDYRFRTIARLASRCGSPPSRAAGYSGDSVRRAIHWSSRLHIPQHSSRARLHRSLPHAPAGESRWAERYDGKGNLHIQHAA